MDTSFDLVAWLMAVAIGLIFLMIIASEGSNKRPRVFGHLGRLLYRQKAPQEQELREAFSSASDLGSTMKSLPDWAQLEMAEHLILEGPPFAAIALDAVSRIAQTMRGDLRSTALNFLISSTIPFVARVSLAQRLLVSAIDDETKIFALKALCAMASEPEVCRTGLIDSVTYTVTERIIDGSPKVQAFAVAALESTLRESVSAMDNTLAKKLSRTKGASLTLLIRFIDRNSSLVPQASKRARLYDARP